MIYIQESLDNLTLANLHLPDNLQHCHIHTPLTVYIKLPLNLHARLISTNFPRICSANYPGYTAPNHTLGIVGRGAMDLPVRPVARSRLGSQLKQLFFKVNLL